MTIYLAMTHFMGGSDAIAVFASREGADRWLLGYRSEHGNDGGPEIKQIDIEGPLTEPGVVWIVNALDTGKDIHFVVSVNGNQSSAENASGRKGHVERREIKP